MIDQLVTLAVAMALILTTLTMLGTALYRRTLKPWWQRFTWTPRCTPGIRAEVIMVMGDDGHVGCVFEKLPPGANTEAIVAHMTERWFTLGESLGVGLSWTSKHGAVIETPTGREYAVELMRPSTPKVIVMREGETLPGGEVGGA